MESPVLAIHSELYEQGEGAGLLNLSVVSDGLYHSLFCIGIDLGFVVLQ